MGVCIDTGHQPPKKTGFYRIFSNINVQNTRRSFDQYQSSIRISLFSHDEDDGSVKSIIKVIFFIKMCQVKYVLYLCNI